MPLKGIPSSIPPELLFVLAKMGHGDTIVITDSNFPSDSVATHTINKVPVRVAGATFQVMKNILTLMPLDRYSESPVCVMDRVQADKDSDVDVPAYDHLFRAVQNEVESSKELYGACEFSLTYVERFQFYELAKQAFCIVQTTDKTPYANVLISKGVL